MVTVRTEEMSGLLVFVVGCTLNSDDRYPLVYNSPAVAAVRTQTQFSVKDFYDT